MVTMAESLGVRKLMNCRPLAFASLLILSAVSLAAKDKEVEELLSKMRTAYKTTKSAKMTVETTIEGFEKGKLTTKVSYVAPNKIHARVTGLADGAEITLVTDGKLMLISSPNGNITTDYGVRDVVRA